MKALGSRSEAAKKAWATMRRKGIKPAKKSKKKPKKAPKQKKRRSPAQKAAATKKKGKRLTVRSPSKIRTVRKGVYAPPSEWWKWATKEPHGAKRKPLTAAAAGHLWFKVYDDKKRLAIIRDPEAWIEGRKK